MKEYCKIHSVWKRAQEKPCQILVGEFARPEFAYLERVPWIATEKVDGTNVRVMWNGFDVTFGGKTDNAQMPTPLLKVLQQQFLDVDRWRTQFPSFHEQATQVCLYGEGFGGSIQRGGATYGPNQRFVLFDVKVGPWWLERAAVEDVARGMGCDVVPIVGEGYLRDLCRHVEIGVKSSYGDFLMEGFVMKPTVTLMDRKGDRILAKIKTSDYRTLGKYTVMQAAELAKELAAGLLQPGANRELTLDDDCPRCTLPKMALTQHRCVMGSLEELNEGSAGVIEVKPDQES